MQNTQVTQLPSSKRYEAIVEPTSLEFYDSFGNAYINTVDGQRFMLNQNTDPAPAELKAAFGRAQNLGQNLYLRFEASDRNYITKIDCMGEIALAAGSKLPVPFTTPIGPERTGTVVIVSQDLGTGYVQEDVTGRTFALSGKFQNAAVFGKIVGNATIDSQARIQHRQGSRVKFRENGRNCIATIEPLKP